MDKKYCVVEFTLEKSVAAVPSIWIKDDQCAWPPYKSNSRITESILKNQPPEASWGWNPVRVLYRTDSFRKATEKVKKAEEQTDIDTEREKNTSSMKERSRILSESDDDIPIPAMGMKLQSKQRSKTPDITLATSYSKEVPPMHPYVLQNPPPSSQTFNSNLQHVQQIPEPHIQIRSFSKTPDTMLGTTYSQELPSMHPYVVQTPPPSSQTFNSNFQHVVQTPPPSSQSFNSNFQHVLQTPPSSSQTFNSNFQQVQQIPEPPSQTHSSHLFHMKYQQATESEKAFRWKVFEELFSIKQELVTIRQLAAANPNATKVAQLPDNCPRLPVHNVEDVIIFNDFLKVDRNLLKMCNYLRTTGGISVKDCTRRVIQRLISNPLALKHNWMGSRGDKVAFCQYKHVLKLIAGAVRKHGGFEAATDYEINEAVKRWLMHAKDREGGRDERGRINFDKRADNIDIISEMMWNLNIIN